MTYHFYNVPLVDSHCRKEGQCADMDLTSCAASVHGMVSIASTGPAARAVMDWRRVIGTHCT